MLDLQTRMPPVLQGFDKHKVHLLSKENSLIKSNKLAVSLLVYGCLVQEPVESPGNPLKKIHNRQ
jgi:hypothetical protein